MRERHARLLADSRSAEPRARLAQAVSRAEFLLRLSRTVSAIQNPERALLALVDLLLEDVVDVAQVFVRTGTHQLVCSGVQGQTPVTETRLLADGSPDGVDEAIRSGVPQDVVLSQAGRTRRRTLSSLLQGEEIVEAVDALGTDQLTVLPLTARGRTFGLLVLGRGKGYGFSGSHAFLGDLADRVAVGLDATLVVAESRYVAGVLRRSLAPAEIRQVPGLQIASFYRVAHQSEAVGGDFIDVHGPDDDLVVVCGDVAGKGVEAAVHAKRIRNAIRTAAHVDRDPGWSLGLVNRVLVSETHGDAGGLATAVLARMRPAASMSHPDAGPDAGDREPPGSVHVTLASAGHPPALIVRSDGTVEEAPARGLLLALMAETDYTTVTTTLRPRDTLLLYTDGVTEARGLDDLFGEERLHEALSRLGGLSAPAVVEAVAVAVSEHLGDRAHDDIAMLAIHVLPEPT
ncbi:PP2C family protein-serine/threonine phosphatase [Nocardioides ferulae]|uniref:PP2C family protein-serine/threonine phosphatase n=1 Tax=Nocardioides ferulae TaxID=2340821 RepID=UPI000F863A6C|nr:PP2C family protein-serine/threonine phosphatase [Nocardioides ferulae]